MDLLTAIWSAGPDAGQATTLAPGPSFVGRAATCEVRSDDTHLESHHLRLDVGTDGVVAVLPLAGARPAAGTVRAPVSLHLGASVLTVRAGCVTREPAHVRRGQVLRTPRAPHPPPPVTVTVPDEHPPLPRQTTGLLPAAVALVGAAVVAQLLHQPMFLIFAGVGASVALVSWLAQALAQRRTNRRRAADAAAASATFGVELAAHHQARLDLYRATTVTLADAIAWITLPAAELWQRRANDPDCLAVSLGIGPLTVEALLTGPLKTGDLRGTHSFADEAVAADLNPGRCIALRGDEGGVRAVCRSMVIQAMAAAGPADLRVVVVTDTPEHWKWLRAAPHLTLARGDAIVGVNGLAECLAALGPNRQARLLIVTDQPEQLASRTSPIRRALCTAGGVAPAVVVLVPAEQGVPDICTAALEIGQLLRARWTPTLDDAASVPVHASGISELRAGALVDRLARLGDPDDPLGVDSRLPIDLPFAGLVSRTGVDPTSATSIAAGWVAGGADPRLSAPIGIASDGRIDIDLVNDGPHALVAGTTGAGKSELLRSFIVGLSVLSSPEHLGFVLIDYKGGATFDACAALPHVTAVISDLDDRLAERALRSLRAELRRRESVLRHHGATDLTELRSITGTARLPRLVVVVDEFAALVAEQPDFLHALVGIAQRGRSLGIHLILATQRPRGVVSDDIRANTTLRIALRLLDRADAIDVVGDPAPATFPRTVPGRAMLRLSDDEQIVFQTAHGGDGEIFRTTAAAVTEAAVLVGACRPPAPWQPPLPAFLHPLPGGRLGWIDDPDAQHTEELVWSPRDGNVLVAARRGMGVTNALRALAIAALRPQPGAAKPVHVVIIDARGSGPWGDIDDHPSCSGVVGITDRERLRRCLVAAAAAIESGRTGGFTDEGPDRLIVIDGLEALRADLDQLDTADLHELVDHVLVHGASAGITVVAGVERLGTLPAKLCASFGQQWVGHLADAHDGLVVGVGPAALPAEIPGRFVIAQRGLEMQLCVAPEMPVQSGRVVRAPRLDRLGERIEVADLAGPSRGAHGIELPIGMGFDTLTEQCLVVPDGSHVLVIGQPRSGRTTALATVAAQWERGGFGWIGWVHGRRRTSPGAVLDAMPGSGPRLLIVDDAELVQDDEERLSAAANGKSAGLVVVAAGAPEPLRRMYGHWTAAVRSSRIGLVAASCAEADGDLLAANLPRRCPVTPRPGLMWLADNGPVRLVQVAVGGE